MTFLDYQARQDLVSAGVAEALRALGVSSGEISQAQARQLYGKWFREAVDEGRLRPCRVGTGKTSTKWFRVSDILTLKSADAERAAIQLEAISK